MTQQYIVGELSVLVAGLCPDRCPALAECVRDLRHRVERTSPTALAPLVREAVDLADRACWTSLEAGDMDWFSQQAAGAAVLREFAICAGLLV